MERLTLENTLYNRMKNSKNCWYYNSARSFFKETVKFLSHKNIFTHSFVSIDDYPMSEVLDQGLEKCKTKNIRLKKINMSNMFS
jgi:hypothetical protein